MKSKIGLFVLGGFIGFVIGELVGSTIPEEVEERIIGDTIENAETQSEIQKLQVKIGYLTDRNKELEDEVESLTIKLNEIDSDEYYWGDEDEYI